MNIERLKSGSYRARRRIDGKDYRVTFDHRPTRREAELAINQLASNNSVKCGMSFTQALNSYLELKSNVLSPTVITSHKVVGRTLSKEFVNKQLDQITQIDVQREINQLAKSHSPKTVRNYHGVISVVLKTFRPDFTLKTTLPQRENKEIHIPTDEEVKKLLEYAKGSNYEVPLKLAVYCGLRRSEIYGLTDKDVKGNREDGYYIEINKAVVLNEDREKVVKTTKTTSSTRTLYIPEDVALYIRQHGYAINNRPDSFTTYVTRVTGELEGVERFTLHSLRHFFVSTLSDNGVSDENIIKLSGHQTDYVMKAVYRHAKNVEQAKKDAQNIMQNVINFD